MLEKLYQYIQHCENEECINKELADLLRGRQRVLVKVGGLSLYADAAKDSEAYEVKLDAEPYDGIGQALAYKSAGYKAHLVHVLDKRRDQFDLYVELYRRLSLDFCVHVITKDGKYWSSCPR